jgi:hypothetical protein
MRGRAVLDAALLPADENSAPRHRRCSKTKSNSSATIGDGGYGSATESQVREGEAPAEPGVATPNGGSPGGSPSQVWLLPTAARQEARPPKCYPKLAASRTMPDGGAPVPSGLSGPFATGQWEPMRRRPAQFGLPPSSSATTSSGTIRISLT